MTTGLVAAHGDDATSMELPATRIAPGTEMPVVGLDFFPGERLRMVLTGPDGEHELGSVQAGPDGHFEAFLDVPGDVPAGPHTLDAISTSGIIVRAVVDIDPTAPPASYRPVFPTAVERNPAPDVDLVPFAALGLAVGGLTLLVRRSRRATASAHRRWSP